MAEKGAQLGADGLNKGLDTPEDEVLKYYELCKLVQSEFINKSKK